MWHTTNAEPFEHKKYSHTIEDLLNDLTNKCMCSNQQQKAYQRYMKYQFKTNSCSLSFLFNAYIDKRIMFLCDDFICEQDQNINGTGRRRCGCEAPKNKAISSVRANSMSDNDQLLHNISKMQVRDASRLVLVSVVFGFQRLHMDELRQRVCWLG